MSSPRLEPPRAAERLLELIVSDDTGGRSILGDAREEFIEHASSGTRLSASIWYWRHVLGMGFRYFLGASATSSPLSEKRGIWRIRLSTTLDDISIAARMVMRRPGLALAAVVTLGLGIGANTTIFSLVYWVLIRPLPYPNAEQLVSVYRIDPDVTGRDPSPSRLANLYAVPYEVFGDWAEVSSSFENMGAYFTTSFTLTGIDRPDRIQGAMVTSGVFASLGIAPMTGRTFQPSDDEIGSPVLAILSHELWQSRYGSDQTVVGRRIVLSGYSYEIVGVMPPDFGFPDDGVEVWTTFEDRRKTSPVRSGGYLQVLARLKPGISLQQAQLDVDAVARRIGEMHPEEVEHGIGLFPRKSLEIASVRGGLVMLLGAVGLVLLIACANIANLLLVRATERRRELGVRMALGASRGRLVAQFMGESALLSLVGGMVGCSIAVLSLSPLKAAFPGGLPRSDSITIDYRMLLFAVLLSVATGLLIGALPAIGALRTPVVNVLQEGGRANVGGRRRSHTQSLLVITEVALAFVLLVGAGLFIRSLSRLTEVDYGFDAENLITMGVSLPARYRDSNEAALGFFNEFTASISGLPGVRAVGTANQVPFVGGWSTPPTFVETSGGVVEAVVHRSSMNPGYFGTMGVPIVAGRGLSSADIQGNDLVSVVNETMARRYWPDENPLGRRVGGLIATADTVWTTVVGVVRDVRFRLNMDPIPSFHIPLAQWPASYQWVVVRAAVDPAGVTPAIRDALAAIDPEIPLRVLDLEEQIHNSSAVTSPRFGIIVMSSLAGLAALLAFIGIYGVLAYTVQQRAHEIGVQLALGASRTKILQRVLLRGIQMTGTGLIIGVALSVGASRVISSLLFETSPTDPVTLAAVSLLVAIAALGASYVPALRATRVSPLEVLRQE